MQERTEQSIRFVLNGSSVCVRGFTPETTLLDYIRGAGFTGSKEGCAEGECGACAVLVVKSSTPATSKYQAVNSCLYFLPMAAGQEIYTIEALASGGQLAEVQQAFVDRGGSQCGYCTPGFVMSLFAEQYRPGREGPCRSESMGGNLCRCTGYRPIRDAAESLGPAPGGIFLDRLSTPAPLLDRVETESFSRPVTLIECLRLMAENPSARLVAGATDLAVESNLHARRFERLISVEAIPEVQVLRETDSEVEIGAGLSLFDIESRWLGAPLIVSEWLNSFASPLVRNRATLGGNLATASPIGDSAPMLLALDAQVRIAGLQGQRTVALEEFFVGYRSTAMKMGELLVSISIPKPFPKLTAFYKVAKRRLDDISTVAAGFGIDLDAQGRVVYARIAYGGVAAIPLRVKAAEETITGLPWNDATMKRAQELISRTLQPISDHRGSAAYRKELALSLLEKFWHERKEQAA